LLNGKSAIVTGSSRGIGRAIAERLGANGASVIVNYRSDGDAAEKVVATIKESGGLAVAIQADVSDADELRGLFDAAEEHFGGLDIVVSNVGIARFAPLVEFTDEDYELIFATNTRATFRTLREAAKRVRDNGRIVVISSVAAAACGPNSSVYAASKASGDALMRVLAKELGPRGITANSVLPGAVRTDALLAFRPAKALDEMAARTPRGRIGEPDDIAEIVAFLASDAARWVSGQAVHAGGGMF
jgi:3-oxoacyl-[acyl-carrier protein] reductase